MMSARVLTCCLPRIHIIIRVRERAMHQAWSYFQVWAELNSQPGAADWPLCKSGQCVTIVIP